MYNREGMMVLCYLLIVVLLFIIGCTQEGEHGETPAHAEQVHWGYEGEEGPAAWEDLCVEYVLCAEGKQQSPINIADTNTLTNL